MYDNVTLQNNKNIGDALAVNNRLNGAGVLISTYGDIFNRQAEFIMKGGTIRGNINNTKNPYRCGGGVQIAGFGIFTMEGGVIMNNTADRSGGGVYMDASCSFKKTGGIRSNAVRQIGYKEEDGVAGTSKKWKNGRRDVIE
jgi:predicted outer membrane repeat protein